MDISETKKLAKKIFALKWPFTEADLRKAYRSKVKELRPDLGRNTGKFDVVKKAYELLLAALRKRFSDGAMLPANVKGQKIDIYV